MKFLKNYKCKCTKKSMILSIIILLGLFLSYMTGYIFAGAKFIPPHYHANFAIYVNNNKLDFSADKYMEDIAGCSISGKLKPQDRAHLHQNNGDTIHIHDEGVAWGHFFANIGVTFTDSSLSWGEEGRYFSDNVIFVLNGKVIKNPYNKSINSMDRLLVTVGDMEVEGAMQQYETVKSDAGEFNEKYDPGSCGGTNENGIIVLLREFVASIMHPGMDHNNMPNMKH